MLINTKHSVTGTPLPRTMSSPSASTTTDPRYLYSAAGIENRAHDITKQCERYRMIAVPADTDLDSDGFQQVATKIAKLFAVPSATVTNWVQSSMGTQQNVITNACEDRDRKYVCLGRGLFVTPYDYDERVEYTLKHENDAEDPINDYLIEDYKSQGLSTQYSEECLPRPNVFKKLYKLPIKLDRQKVFGDRNDPCHAVLLPVGTRVKQVSCKDNAFRYILFNEPFAPSAIVTVHDDDDSDDETDSTPTDHDTGMLTPAQSPANKRPREDDDDDDDTPYTAGLTPKELKLLKQLHLKYCGDALPEYTNRDGKAMYARAQAQHQAEPDVVDADFDSEKQADDDYEELRHGNPEEEDKEATNHGGFIDDSDLAPAQPQRLKRRRVATVRVTEGKVNSDIADANLKEVGLTMQDYYDEESCSEYEIDDDDEESCSDDDDEDDDKSKVKVDTTFLNNTTDTDKKKKLLEQLHGTEKMRLQLHLDAKQNTFTFTKETLQHAANMAVYQIKLDDM